MKKVCLNAHVHMPQECVNCVQSEGTQRTSMLVGERLFTLRTIDKDKGCGNEGAMGFEGGRTVVLVLGVAVVLGFYGWSVPSVPHGSAC